MLGRPANLYDRVTAAIVEQMEAGAPPWVKPWTSDGVATGGLPFNAQSKREYSGINTLLLWSKQADMGWSTQGYLTLNQVKELGGRLRPIPELQDPARPGHTGQRPTMIVYYGSAAKKESGGEKVERFRFLKTFFVFNVDQCEGLPPTLLQPVNVPTIPEAMIASKSYVDALGVNVVYGGDQACYRPSSDTVHMPRSAAFLKNAKGDVETASAYMQSTLLHEVGHWSGAAHRLDREGLKSPIAFGSDKYAREELIAEIHAAFQCARFGLPGIIRHAGYLDTWCRVLRADSRAIFNAASLAKKAVEWCDARVVEATPYAEAAE
jgi:antirestriction protein ArdC